MLAALDLTTGRLPRRIQSRKRHGKVHQPTQALRPPTSKKLHLAMDNFLPHRHLDVRKWAAGSRVDWSSC